MFQRSRSALICGLIAMQLVLGVARATPDGTPLSTALEAHRYALNLQQVETSSGTRRTALSGPGAARLIENARQSQFVLIGEDHGFGDVATFTQALHGELAALRFNTLALEIGNVTAARVDAALKADAGALHRMDIANPSALPFLNWSEEAKLVGDLVRAPNPVSLLGVDQEFILSTGPHFARLAELAPNESARALAQSYLARDTEAVRAMTDEHDPGKVVLPQLTDADFSSLRGAFSGHGATTSQPEAGAIIDALAESAMIYRTQQTDPYASNNTRSRLMKRNFMKRYRELLATESRPRILLKMGANHMGRGISPTNQFDLGNMVSELAESSGGRSYHLLVVVAEGTVNRWLPFMPPEMQHARYDGHAEFDALGVGPLIDMALVEEWSLFDVAALRTQPELQALGGPAFKQLIHSYDAVLVVRNAEAAQMLQFMQ